MVVKTAVSMQSDHTIPFVNIPETVLMLEASIGLAYPTDSRKIHVMARATATRTPRLSMNYKFIRLAGYVAVGWFAECSSFLHSLLLG